MGLRQSLLLIGTLLLGIAPASGAESAGWAFVPTLSKPGFHQTVEPFLAKYCTHCHGGAKPKAGLALDIIHDEAALAKNPKVWKEIARMVHEHEMPPIERKVRPTPKEIDLVTTWIDGRLKTTASLKRDPGRVTLRRLNRAEYNNTIRDLVGVDFHPADDFPADDVGYGFDNIGDVLSLPPILMEKYLAAAEKIVDKALADPAIHERILQGQPKERNVRISATRVLQPFVTRAFRRPVTREEMRRLVEFVELADSNRDGFEAGIKLALEATLVSPHFLFRVEMDPKGGDADSIRSINDYELASRLSYFLWSSMPDDELFQLARGGTLRDGDNLANQVRRMLKDSKSRAMVDNFADQWLQIRNLKTVAPDPRVFPAFSENLRADMQRETELFFANIMREDRSILEFLDADYTFVNERLAKLYGIPEVKGPEFRKVSLEGTSRGGVLTQASILTITSNPTRTSPVKRGKWILENILDTPPPPPPPDAGELSEDPKVVESGSLRQRLELHRSKPLCAACHQRMDPLGFGFENFNPIGAWRDKDGKFAIDASGVLPDGKAFNGPRELKAILKSRVAQFRRCLSDKMLTYALGRGLEDGDQGWIDEIAAATARGHDKFSSLVLAIVNSDPFQKRKVKRGEP